MRHTDASDLIGTRCFQILITKDLGYDGSSRWVEGQCDCGVIRKFRVGDVRLKKIQSCGCRRVEFGKSKATHGHTRNGSLSPTYGSHRSMLERCENPTNKNYHLYGSRGIKVYEQWHVFENFLADMGKRPEGKTIDRIDTNGNYEPGNCKWSTDGEQARNKRNSQMKKLTPENIVYIKETYSPIKRGRGSNALAKQFGVHKRIILAIVRGTEPQH